MIDRRPGAVDAAVTVYVAADRNRRMPEQVGDRFDVHARL
jgi:hypothetical protein